MSMAPQSSEQSFEKCVPLDLFQDTSEVVGEIYSSSVIFCEG